MGRWRLTHGTCPNPSCATRSRFHIILRLAGRVDFEVNPKGAIYKNVCMISHCHHSLFKVSGYSTSVQQLASCYWLHLIGTYHDIHLWKSTVWVYYAKAGHSMGQKGAHWLLLPVFKAEGGNKNVYHYIFYIISNLLLNIWTKWPSLFCNGGIICRHICSSSYSSSGGKDSPGTQSWGSETHFPSFLCCPSTLWSWSKSIYLPHSLLILEYCIFQVQHVLLLLATETITLKMIHHTGKPPSPLPRSFNNSNSKFSTWGTGFNESSCSEQTHGLIKFIVHKPWQESYNKVVAGAKQIVKTHSSVHTEEVIDLTSDKPPDEFAMIVDLPLDKEDGNMVVVKMSLGIRMDT